MHPTADRGVLGLLGVEAPAPVSKVTNACTGASKTYLEIPGAFLPIAISSPTVGLAWTLSSQEASPIQRHPQYNLARRYTSLHIILQRLRSAKRCRLRIPLIRKEICLMTRSLIPRPRIIVSHEIDEVKTISHFLQMQFVVVLWPSRRSDGEQEMRRSVLVA